MLKSPEGRRGELTLMASGIIKIINIYHKKERGTKKKYIYMCIRRMVFLSQKKKKRREPKVTW